jgi:tetratricopeptide (TPR) repeat protein
MARQLMRRGLFVWGRREYEHVINQGSVSNELGVSSRLLLSETLHDQGQDLDAAHTLEKLSTAADTGKISPQNLFGHTPGSIRSQTNYYYACHWLSKNDVAKQRECLDKALKADPTDIEVLIACYRLPNQPADYHDKIAGMVRRTAAVMHEKVAEEPESSHWYNQYAWLVGNTEGDFDEAIRCSLKSVELASEENRGGYYDTLAHVYFGKGDYENAVKYEAKAAEMEPHMGMIKRKLEVFRKKLEEKKTAEKKNAEPKAAEKKGEKSEEKPSEKAKEKK